MFPLTSILHCISQTLIKYILKSLSGKSLDLGSLFKQVLLDNIFKLCVNSNDFLHSPSFVGNNFSGIKQFSFISMANVKIDIFSPLAGNLALCLKPVWFLLRINLKYFNIKSKNIKSVTELAYHQFLTKI
jgi:hypothetical protein